MNLDVYEEDIEHEGKSAFSMGRVTKGKIHHTAMVKTPLVQAFLDDDDIQEITISSSNLLFTRRFRKLYRQNRNPNAAVIIVQ